MSDAIIEIKLDEFNSINPIHILMFYQPEIQLE
jgi:hypothetical protein